MVIISSAFQALMAILSVIGYGYVLVKLLLRDEADKNTNEYVIFASSFAFGTFIISIFVLIVGNLGFLYEYVVNIILYLGVILSFLYIRRLFLKSYILCINLSVYESIILFILVVLLIMLFLITSSSFVVHPDALQYHIALPMHYLQMHKLYNIPTVDNDRVFLMLDLQYLLVIDPSNLTNLLPSKYFNLFSGFLVFPSVYFLSRELGADRFTSLLITLLLATTPNYYGGELKNDTTTTFYVLHLFHIASYYEKRLSRWWLILALMLGITLSTKMTILPAVGIIYLWMLYKRHEGFGKTVLIFVLSMFIWLPWLTHAVVYSESIMLTSGGKMSEFRRHEWAVRSANGLKLTFGNYCRNIFNLLLARGNIIPDNWSMGIPFIIALFVGFYTVLTNKIKGAGLVVIAAFASLFVFSLNKFETRFLNRYIAYVAAMYLAGVAPTISKFINNFKSKWIVIILAIVMVFTSQRCQDTYEHFSRLDLKKTVTGESYYESIVVDPQIKLWDQANKIVPNGDKIIINDGFFYFLKCDFINVHFLHSDYIHFGTVTYEEFENIMKKEHVVAAIIRPGISGLSPIVTEYIDKHMQEVMSSGGLLLYQDKLAVNNK